MLRVTNTKREKPSTLACSYMHTVAAMDDSPSKEPFNTSSGIGVSRARRNARTSFRRSDTAAVCAALESAEHRARTAEGALCPKPQAPSPWC